MAGFLDTLLGSGGDDPRSQAMGLLAAGLMQGNAAGGLLAANQHFAGEPERRLRRGLLEAQLAETMAQADERKTRARKEQEALELAQRRLAALPGLFGQTMSPGAFSPTADGMGPTLPQSSAPQGGLDWKKALLNGYTPDEIQKLAGLSNIGRSEVARTIETMRNGRPVTLQFDKYGQPVGQAEEKWQAPHFHNLGNRTAALDPVTLQERGSFAQGVDPNTVYSGNITMRGQNMTDARARATQEQGKWQYDAQRGGLVNMQTGEFKPAMQNGQPVETKESRAQEKEALQRRSAIENAGSVLKEVKDAQNMVGLNTAGFGGVMSKVPATEGRDLAGKLQSIKANLGFDRLQQMRAESPTGGALGQVAVQELQALQATVASLDQYQSPTQLRANLDKIEKHYSNWRNVMQQAQGSQGGASGGWSIREKK